MQSDFFADEELAGTCEDKFIAVDSDLATLLGRPESVNKLARAVTKWEICGRRLARLISYIHQASKYRQYCFLGNTAQQCRLGLFQDSDFAGDFANSTSTSGEILCIFGTYTIVPTNWMCKKQTSVSHSSTEAGIISLDGSLRMDGVPALTLWDFGDLSFSFRIEKNRWTQESHGETRRQLSSQTCITTSQTSTPTSFPQTLITFHQIQRILVPALCCMFWKSMTP